MIPLDCNTLFAPAFETFKAFDDLTVDSSSSGQQAFPASIWQILQHLLMWQEHQLARVGGAVSAEPFNEKRSWNSERQPPSEEALQAAVTQFKYQLAALQALANHVTEKAPEASEPVVVLQEAALHLSFHLGEVVLIRRLLGSYPWPAQMAKFLQA